MKLFELFSDLEPLNEAQGYESMFGAILNLVPEEFHDTVIKLINGHISFAKNVLKRNDRIVWYLRHAKVFVLNRFLNILRSISGGYNPDVTTASAQREDKMRDAKAALEAMHDRLEGMGFGSNRAIDPTRDAQQYLTHYMGMNIPKIDNHVFGKESMNELLDLFAKYEDEAVTNKKQQVGIVDPNDREIINFGNKGWWLLDRETCRAEADAMGHCGNEGGIPGHRILSFRTQIDKETWKPHLTFIIGEDGLLGEMKGRANEKPAKRYHPFIVELLKHDMVKGIVGGGYLPESNFSMDDLEPAQREELIELKPSLGPLLDMYRKEGMTDLLQDLIEVSLDSAEIEYAEVTNEHVIWDALNSMRDVVMTYGNDASIWLLRVADGEEYIESVVEAAPADVEDLINVSSDEQRELMTAFVKENYAEEFAEFGGGDVSWITMSDFILEEVEEIKDAARDAVITGTETATMVSAYNALKQEIDDPTGNYNSDSPVSFKFILRDNKQDVHNWSSPRYIATEMDEVLKAIDHGVADQIELDDRIIQVSDYDSFYGYDEDTTKERFSDLLTDL